ncbi:MAG: hypothetical protein ABJF23_09890 [Bryobacteraceae bacterium]
MKADHVNVSWDTAKRKWLVRVEVGSEVIRRYCDKSKDADDQALRTAAAETVADEGYEVAAEGILVQR